MTYALNILRENETLLGAAFEMLAREHDEAIGWSIGTQALPSGQNHQDGNPEVVTVLSVYVEMNGGAPNTVLRSTGMHDITTWTAEDAARIAQEYVRNIIGSRGSQAAAQAAQEALAAEQGTPLPGPGPVSTSGHPEETNGDPLVAETIRAHAQGE